MARNIAPPKNTGGGGFIFEDRVCAWFLACMLVYEPPLETDLGRLQRVDFQTRPDGWYLDDILLTLDMSGTQYRCALSIKSNVQFTRHGAPSDFVRIVWEQFLHEGSTCFDQTKDYMGLVTVTLPNDIKTALSSILGKAIAGDPQLLPARYAEKGWANETERSLFQSFMCPPDLAAIHGVTNGDTGRVLARLRFLNFDFGDTVSDSEKFAVNLCRRALKSGGLDEASKLWRRLQQISADLRPKAGYMTREGLLDCLRTEFDLADRPDHMSDWDRLKELTRTFTAQVQDSIGGRVKLPRGRDIEKLQATVAKAPAVVLLGPSGVGKSAIAKRWIEQRLGEGKKCLWFDAQSFERQDFAAFEADLGLKTGLAELLGTVPDSNVVLVLDGLDRLYDASAFGLLAYLLRFLRLERQETPWRVVITCQTQEWPRLKRTLRQAQISTIGWEVVECEPLKIDDLKPIWEEIPQAARLPYQSNLHPLLVNLKILDLIAVRLLSGDEILTSEWVGESSVAAWFWETQIVQGPDGPQRTRFMTMLAERQADALKPGIPVDEFSISDLAPLHDLEVDRICRRTPDDQVVFEHDLFGDWARLRLLLSRSGDLPGFLKERLDSPLWHRAVRLYGLHLLEHAGDVDKWRATLVGFANEGDGVVQDLLLESAIFAANPEPLLERIRPDLVQDNGRLLRRLLKRFLVYATLPHPFFTALARSQGEDEVEAAAYFRYPNWPYWPSILSFLYRHRTEMLSAAPVEVGEVIELWLKYAPTGAVLRREAAEIGLMLGERTLHDRHFYTGDDNEHRKLYYRVALAGAGELPDEVTDFALRASKRLKDASDIDPPPLDPDRLPAVLRLHPRFDPNEPMPDPWPDGPREMVDDNFREVALETAALMPLIRVRPATAREVVLAVLIQPCRRFEWYWEELDPWDLDLNSGRRWHPPLYTHGPFLGFLKANFIEGLELITRLVDFATERWSHYIQKEAHKHEDGEGARDHDNGLLGRLLSERRQVPGHLIVPFADGDREFLGDERIYGWAAGLGNPPSAVEVALMALEKYFYMEMDEGRPIDEKVRLVLERGRSVAFIKVLCDIGKREPAFFEGPIRELLAAPEIYEWDITTVVHGRDHLMIGAFMHGAYFVKLAREFHNLEHRQLDLRQIALELFFNRPAMRAFLTEARKRWEAALAATPKGRFHDFLCQLVVTFNVENYRVEEHPEHGYVLVNECANELETERAEEQQAFMMRYLVTSLPVRCRQIINEGIGLPDDQLETFWNDLQRIVAFGTPLTSQTDQTQPVSFTPTLSNWRIKTREGLLRYFRVLRGAYYWIKKGNIRPADKQIPVHPTNQRYEPETDGFSHQNIINAVMGAIAILVRFHRDWLARYPDRKQWCLEQLQTIVWNPPPLGQFEVPESIAAWTWDCFAAEAFPVLWAEEPGNRELRTLVARLVFAPHYVAVEILFRRCAEYRTVLGSDFGRLRRLLFEWANVRERLTFVTHFRGQGDEITEKQIQRFLAAVDKWAGERIEAFVKGRSPWTVDVWKDMDDRRRFREIDKARKRWQRYCCLDLKLVQAAHAWLPTLDQALDIQERRDWLGFWREALRVVLKRPASADEESMHVYPYEDEQWVLDGVAAIVQYMDSKEDPEFLWKPIFVLPREAHNWSEDFLQAFHRHACL